MKPNFALMLSLEGIGLLHRTAAGWHLVGEVGLDNADLQGALGTMVAKARALDPTGLRSKVIIPNDQIKYLSFETDSHDIDIIEAQVRSTLNASTSYDLTELAYDWSMRDGNVYVAAVAIETLTEAESFALDHAFSPMCFVTMPERGTFEGEPFLGETVHAGKVLGPGETVVRDNTPIKVVGMAKLPEPEPVVEDVPVAEHANGLIQEDNPQVDNKEKQTDGAAEPKPWPPGSEAAFVAAEGAVSEKAAELGRTLRVSKAPEPTRPIAQPGPASKAKADPSLAHAPPQAFEDTAQRMTVFGARNPEHTTHERSRFLALYLTVALLVFLVGVAAWAAFFLEDGVSGLFRSPKDVQFAGGYEPPVSEAAAVDPSLSRTPMPNDARARHPAPEIWQLAPEAPATPTVTAMADFYQVALDPAVALAEAGRLPNLDQDNRGFVATTPEGRTIVAGTSPVKPSEYPNRPSEAETEPVGSESDVMRPRARPATLREAFERAHNGGRTLAELSEIRPPLRPENFERIVARARAAAAARPVSEEQRVAVTIPTAASVAQAATKRNQISLRRINLIGVYGPANDRRALVRMANGRYRKVQVGDRLDGGRVVAIGEGELRYIKSGRSLVLKMPEV